MNSPAFKVTNQDEEVEKMSTIPNFWSHSKASLWPPVTNGPSEFYAASRETIRDSAGG